MNSGITYEYPRRFAVPRPNYRLGYKPFVTIFIIGLILCLANRAMPSVYTTWGGYGGFLGLAALAAGFAAVPRILSRPIWGLYVLPFVSFLPADGIRLLGVPMLSPGLALTSLTLAATFLYLPRQLAHLRISLLWFPFLVMLIFNIIIVVGGDITARFRLLLFLQGIAPFVLFTLNVRCERDGRRVLACWVLAYALACASWMFYAVFTGEGSLLADLARLRTQQLTGNPNSQGWTDLLCLPLCMVLVLTAARKYERWLWEGAFVCIVMLLIFVFSRASMFGMVMTFGLAILLFPSRREYRGYFLVVVFVVMAFLGMIFILQSASSEGVIGAARTKPSLMLDEVHHRVELWMPGWKIFTVSPWFGTLFSGIPLHALPGTHSYFMKVATEFGIFYLLMVIFLFVYLLVCSFKVARHTRIRQLKLMAWGVLIAGLVAIPEAFFGITLVGGSYVQFFLMLAAYSELSWREIRRPSVRPVPIPRKVSFA